MNWLAEIWHFLLGWAGIDIVVGTIAIVIAVLEPPIIAAIIPDLRKWMIAVAVVAFTFLSISGKYYHDGIAVKQAEWDAALAAEAASGAKILGDAELAARADTPDSLRNDKWNRDNRNGPDVH